MPDNFKKDLTEAADQAETKEVIITRQGKPAGILVGFEDEDDWFDYRLEHDPRFLERVSKARQSLSAGQGVRLEDAFK